MTGSAPGGTLPEAPDAQFEAAFARIAEVLAATGSTLEDVVELTSFHIDIRRHFDAFEGVVRQRFSIPGPAWTAVGVADLRGPGAPVEIRAIARTGSRGTA